MGQRFRRSRLDEIRFHFLDLESEKYTETMAACVESGMLTGVEIPCEPDKENELMELLGNHARYACAISQP